MKHWLKKYGVVIAVCVIAFGISAHFALADNTSLADNAKSTGGMMYWIAFSVGKLLQFFSYFTNWALNLNASIVSNNPVVQAGWTITRDIANLGFVLAIIVMAFGTILRYESYQYKKMLWRLVVVALLVNFSLVIAGVVIDAAGVLTQFFMNQFTDPSKVAEALVSAISPQSLLSPPSTSSIVGNILTFGTPTLEFLAGLLFVTLFSLLAAIAILGLGALFFMRFLALSFALITLPLVLLLWIFPGSQKYFSEWKDSFLKWVMFAPIATFFMYLALQVQNRASEFRAAYGAADLGGNASSLFDFHAASIGQMVLVISILMLGLSQATKMGGKVSEFITKTAGWAQGAMLGGFGAVTGAKFAARRIGAMGEDKEKGKSNVATWLSTALSGAKILPGVAFPGAKTLGEKVAGFTKATTEEVEKYQKERLANLPNEALLARANNTALSFSVVESAAIASELAKRKDKDGALTNKVSKERLGDFLKAADRVGKSKELLGARPDLADLISKKLSDGIKAAKTDNIGDHDVEIYDVGGKFGKEAVIDVLANMKTDLVTEFAKVRGGKDQEVFVNSLVAAFKQYDEKEAGKASMKEDDLKKHEKAFAHIRHLYSIARKSPAWTARPEIGEVLIKKYYKGKAMKGFLSEEGFEDKNKGQKDEGGEE